MKKPLTILWLLALLSSGAFAQGRELKAGDRAPDFDLRDQSGQRIQLSALLQQGKVVLAFYRGHWCPFCNRQLRTWQDSLPLIRAKNAQVIAITPEQPEYIRKTINKTDATFPILHDKEQRMMQAYGVAYPLDDNAVTRLQHVGVDLAATNGDAGRTLPVPAVYVINQQGIIEWVYFDPNYRARLSVQELLTHL
jgi:peroxiredoxin